MKKILIGIAIAVLVAAMIIFNVTKNADSRSGNKGKGYEVEAKVIEAVSIHSSTIVNGVVEEVEKNEIMFETPVVVNKLLVKNGEGVKKGDALMEIDTSDLENEIKQLVNNREVQELQLQKMKNMSTSSDASALTLSVDIAEANLDSAQTFYERQNETYEKNKMLFEEGIISQTEVESYKNSADEAKTQISSAELNLKRAKQDLNSFYVNRKSSKENSDIDIAVQMKSIEIIDMNLASAKERLEKAEAAIYSPINGVVAEINVTAGYMASTMQPIMKIVDVTNLKITTNIKEYDINEIKLGQSVDIIGDGIVKNAKVVGKVVNINPLAVSTMVGGKSVRVIPIEISIVSGVEYVKVGYSTECEIFTESKEGVATVSYDMMKKDDEGNDIVFVVNDDNIVEERIVELGVISDFDAEVISGVEIGEKVIVNPLLVIDDGVAVTIKHVEEGE